MMIAGVAVSESDVRELIVLLRSAGLDAVATKLDRDAEVEAHMFNLTTVDREAILRALDDPPTDMLAGLRGVLLRDHEWFQHEGLVQRPAQGLLAARLRIEERELKAGALN